MGIIEQGLSEMILDCWCNADLRSFCVSIFMFLLLCFLEKWSILYCMNVHLLPALLLACFISGQEGSAMVHGSSGHNTCVLEATKLAHLSLSLWHAVQCAAPFGRPFHDPSTGACFWCATSYMRTHWCLPACFDTGAVACGQLESTLPPPRYCNFIPSLAGVLSFGKRGNWNSIPNGSTHHHHHYHACLPDKQSLCVNVSGSVILRHEIDSRSMALLSKDWRMASYIDSHACHARLQAIRRR